jgi:hypothetical protein
MGRALDRAGKIDPGNHGKAPHHRSFAGDGEAILVVDGRVRDADGDITVHQVALVEVDEPGFLLGIGLLDHDCLEARHGRCSPL